MGALPKQRISKARKGNRRAHHHIELPKLINCENPECRAKKVAHHVCPICGTYRGRQVVAASREFAAE